MVAWIPCMLGCIYSSTIRSSRVASTHTQCSLHKNPVLVFAGTKQCTDHRTNTWWKYFTLLSHGLHGDWMLRRIMYYFLKILVLMLDYSWLGHRDTDCCMGRVLCFFSLCLLTGILCVTVFVQVRVRLLSSLLSMFGIFRIFIGIFRFAVVEVCPLVGQSVPKHFP